MVPPDELDIDPVGPIYRTRTLVGEAGVRIARAQASRAEKVTVLVPTAVVQVRAG